MIRLKLTGVDKAFDELDEEVVETVNALARLQAFEATGALKDATPVDTGRARNSWALVENRNQFLDAKSGSQTPFIGPPSKDEIEVLYITNGTPYIEDLNQGSSKQAPARFVETTMLKYFSVDGVLFETINLQNE